jgi:hypothetical protein
MLCGRGVTALLARAPEGARASKYCISRKLPVKMNLHVVHMHMRLAMKGVLKDWLESVLNFFKMEF